MLVYGQHKTDQSLTKFSLKITTKWALFLPIDFWLSLSQKFPQNWSIFREFAPKKFDFFQ